VRSTASESTDRADGATAEEGRRTRPTSSATSRRSPVLTDTLTVPPQATGLPVSARARCGTTQPRHSRWSAWMGSSREARHAG
jgi:hypothetical protein